ncbi:MAG: hypothetical protein JXQ65_15365 [Candidatus Marinimicrobia bacterium]|nr:hypothetical protein [Candidatus Neomarinimicrobiota bacterium]
MRKKSFSPSFLFLIILFALGILFASQYSPGTERIATFSVARCDGDQLVKCVTELERNFDGVEKIFVDTKTNIFSIRYESSSVSIDSVKEFFSDAGVTIESSNSISLMGEKDNGPDKKLFKISFSSLE